MLPELEAPCQLRFRQTQTTVGASTPATTAALTPSCPPSASQPPSSSGSINEMGWLPPSLTTSRCASVVLVQATNGKDGNYEYRYDDWCGSGKVCFPGSRGVDERRDSVST